MYGRSNRRQLAAVRRTQRTCRRRLVAIWIRHASLSVSIRQSLGLRDFKGARAEIAPGRAIQPPVKPGDPHSTWRRAQRYSRDKAASRRRKLAPFRVAGWRRGAGPDAQAPGRSRRCQAAARARDPDAPADGSVYFHPAVVEIGRSFAGPFFFLDALHQARPRVLVVALTAMQRRPDLGSDGAVNFYKLRCSGGADRPSFGRTHCTRPQPPPRSCGRWEAFR